MSSPILIYTPDGGVPIGPVSNPPVYSQADVTQLVEGQAYIDVVFVSAQTTDEWVLVECVVVNELDVDPLNIWPGLITDKTASGFRLQLNGMPDSSNYYLHWAVSGINIAPSPATTYYLSVVGTTFTVRLPPSTTVSGPLTITPDDGGAGGVFSPISVVLTTTSASATFIYTPATYGDVTISTTNSGTLIDPAGIVLTIAAPTYTLIGPSTGSIAVASTDFTVTLTGTVAGTVTVTPSDGGGDGTFTPTTVTLSTAVPSVTFTYTAASAGVKTIGVTNDGGLANPASLGYAVTAPTYSLSGPSTGGNGVPSTNFTVDLATTPAIGGTVVVTPSDGGGGGTFTPTTVSVTTAAHTATFTYTPASNGVKTISVTNDRGLTNPTGLTYTVSFDPTSIAGCKLWLKADSLVLADTVAVDTWTDSSSNGNNATQTGAARPKMSTTTYAINGHPVVFFNIGPAQTLNLTTPISGGTWTVFAVMKPFGAGYMMSSIASSGGGSLCPFGPTVNGADTFVMGRQDYTISVATVATASAHTYTAASVSGVSQSAYIDGASQSTTGVTPSATTTNFDVLGAGNSIGSLGELIVYDNIVGTTDRQAVELYLKNKWGTP